MAASSSFSSLSASPTKEPCFVPSIKQGAEEKVTDLPTSREGAEYEKVEEERRAERRRADGRFPGERRRVMMIVISSGT